MHNLTREKPSSDPPTFKELLKALGESLRALWVTLHTNGADSERDSVYRLMTLVESIDPCVEHPDALFRALDRHLREAYGTTQQVKVLDPLFGRVFGDMALLAYLISDLEQAAWYTDTARILVGEQAPADTSGQLAGEQPPEDTG